MDFIKPGTKLGIEVRFGKYAFMVYNVCAKMTIFGNMDIIDTGIEIGIYITEEHQILIFPFLFLVLTHKCLMKRTYNARR